MRKKLSAPIAEAMAAYAADGAMAFHTPGHKQGKGAHELFRRLVTEEGLRQEVSLMEELDDLHDPHGAIREAEEQAAELYGADAAYLMVNGTTGAIQTMVLAMVRPGDTVLVQRNAHRSVYGALVLSGARPIYLPPETDERLGIPLGVTVETVRRALAAHPEARGAILASPTYYGMTMRLREIAKLLHEANMVLAVDEAHGAHLAFSVRLPMQALDAGADLAAQSTHKLLGAMTQGSLLLTKGGRVSAARLREASSLLQTTSPNQLLMASIDIARLQMAEQGEELWGRAVELSERLRARINEIDGLWCFDEAYAKAAGAEALDPTKLTVQVTGLGLTGPQAEDILRHTYKIQCELSDARNVLFLLTYADGPEEADRLLEALGALARDHRREEGQGRPPAVKLPPEAGSVLAPREAFFADKERLPIAEAVGRIAAEEVTFYPPGVPVLAPGDRVTEEALRYVRQLQELGGRVLGTGAERLHGLQVVKEKA